MKLSKNFDRSEAECPCCKEFLLVPDFITRLQLLRDQYGKPMVINSWYRCRKHNRAIKGSTGSKHLEGIAVDVKVGNSTDRRMLVDLAVMIGFNGIGIAETFVHLDTRNSVPVLWLY